MLENGFGWESKMKRIFTCDRIHRQCTHRSINKEKAATSSFFKKWYRENTFKTDEFVHKKKYGMQFHWKVSQTIVVQQQQQQQKHKYQVILPISFVCQRTVHIHSIRCAWACKHFAVNCSPTRALLACGDYAMKSIYRKKKKRKQINV